MVSPETREVISVLLGIFFSVVMPALVSWLKNVTWPEWKKVGIALFVAISLGALTVLAKGDTDLQDLATAITAIFTASSLIYHSYFKGTELNSRLEEKKVL